MVFTTKSLTDSHGRLARRRTICAQERIFMAKRDGTNQDPDLKRTEEPSELLRELVAHLRQNRTQLREEWVVRISETRLLTPMTKEEIFAEATSVYATYVQALDTKTFEPLQAYALILSARIIPRGLQT